MARQVLFSPVNAFISGRRAAQDEQYANNRNELARMELQNAPQDMQRRNRLLDLQTQGAQQNVAAGQMKLDAEKARYASTELGRALQSGNPREFVLRNIPVLAQKLRETQGVDLSAIDDETAKQILTDMQSALAGQAGIAPDGPAAPMSKQGKIVADQKAGLLTQEQAQAALSGSPKNEPLYYTDDGYVPRSEAVGKKRPVTVNTNQSFQQADKLRDEYNAASKEFITVGDNYVRVREAARDPSAAGDLSLLFAYMKMLDPQSVVREQEFANAQNAAGVPDRIRNLWNKALTGERLNPNQRQDFINQANKLYSGQNKRHETTVKARYTQIAKRFNVDPDNVVGAFDVPPVDESGSPSEPDQDASGPEITATGPNGEKLVLRNGRWMTP